MIVPNELVDGHDMMSALGEVMEEEGQNVLDDEIARAKAAGAGWSSEERRACTRRLKAPVDC